MASEERFGAEHAAKYDEGIRLAVPGYEEMHRMAHHLLRTELGDEARVLVVGAGTGTEAVGLAASSPGWRITGVDPSGDMIRLARRRVAEAGLTNRVALHTGFLEDLPAGEPYDAATALLVTHFVPDDGGRLELLRGIAARLKPGAPFVIADLHGDEGSPAFGRFWSAWRSRQLLLGMQEKDGDEMFRDVRAAVHFVPEERVLSLLQEAGFTAISRFYGALLFGGWVARRADAP